MWVVLIVVGCLSLAAFVVLVEPTLELHSVKKLNAHIAQLEIRVLAPAPDQAALNELNSLLHSSDEFDQCQAAGALQWIGHERPERAAPAVSDLIWLLRTGDGFSSRAAAEALRDIGPLARRSVPDLIAAVKRYPDCDPGITSARALGTVGDPGDHEVLATLRQAAAGRDPLMAEDAREALNNLEIRRQGKSIFGSQTRPVSQAP